MSQIALQTERRVGRRQINHEQMPARFPEGTLKAMDAVLQDGEKRSDFLREAVALLLEKRMLHGHVETSERTPEPSVDLTDDDDEALLSLRR